ncbi:hypothetical protein KJ781_02915 [Patescibacteria group bacterium]|nr:hypothetical protein [Patescibacteria group bacterium]MBU1448794.1 hypothetical protein [Patescibacteria group bacterium]MBU2613595.1 hypothetical protein [Patescibacteria group bacterium]
MPNEDISSRALSAIKNADIEPKPKIAYASREFVYWALAACALAVGALAFAVIVVRVVDMDWDVVPRLGLGTLVRAAPIFWIACAVVFIAIAEHTYRATAFGYRTRFILIIAAYVVLTGLLGTAAYAAGLGDLIETNLVRHVPIYRQTVVMKEDMWARPGDGLLAGRILSVTGTTLLVTDLGGERWDVDISRATIRRRTSLVTGGRIKMIGEATGKGTFTARDIRPWDPPFPRPMAPHPSFPMAPVPR